MGKLCARFLSRQDFARCLQQRLHLRLAANGDTEIILCPGVIEPAHENLPVAQFLEPRPSRKDLLTNKEEVCLARQHAKTEQRQFARSSFPRLYKPLKIYPVIGQVSERRQRSHLTEAIDIVTVANFVERGDKFRMTDKVADPLEAE